MAYDINIEKLIERWGQINFYKRLIHCYNEKSKYCLGVSSEMLGSARPEEDDKYTGEIDGESVCGDGHPESVCPSL